jgi:hypothetical protein
VKQFEFFGPFEKSAISRTLQPCNSEKATMSDNIAIQFRAKRDLYNRLENWRREQDRIPPVADAARHLIERGLDAVASTKPKSKEKGAAA